MLGRAGLPVAVARGEVRSLSLSRADFARTSGAGGQPSIQTVNSQLGRRKSYPWVGQQEAGDCGVAALAMVARCHGRPVDVERIRRLTDVSERGASLLALLRAATELGLPCHAVRVDPLRLEEVALPAVAHLSEGHYVVVYATGPAEWWSATQPRPS